MPKIISDLTEVESVEGDLLRLRPEGYPFGQVAREHGQLEAYSDEPSTFTE